MRKMWVDGRSRRRGRVSEWEGVSWEFRTIFCRRPEGKIPRIPCHVGSVPENVERPREHHIDMQPEKCVENFERRALPPRIESFITPQPMQFSVSQYFDLYFQAPSYLHIANEWIPHSTSWRLRSLWITTRLNWPALTFSSFSVCFSSCCLTSRSLCLRRRFGRVTCTRILGASGRACGYTQPIPNPFKT